MSQVGEDLLPAQPKNFGRLLRLAIYVLGCGLLLGSLISIMILLLPERYPDPFMTLGQPHRSLARRFVSQDSICGGPLVKRLSISVPDRETIRWQCSTYPWGHPFYREATCYLGQWSFPRFVGTLEPEKIDGGRGPAC